MKVDIAKCAECGKSHSGDWMDDVAEELISRGVCFQCNFWLEKVEIAKQEKAVRIKGRHYIIGLEDPQVRMFRGSGGTKFTVSFFDGRVVETTNLWHQGQIPEHFRERLPDNAEFGYKEGEQSVYGG